MGREGIQENFLELVLSCDIDLRGTTYIFALNQRTPQRYFYRALEFRVLSS